MKETFESRFWRRVKKTSGCWEWLGPIGKKHRYGILKRDSRFELAHRVAWELCQTAPIGDLCVLHHCDNRRCVRPDHLFLGTKQDNSDDMFNKGRNYHPAGAASATAKLSDEDVQRIRALRGRVTQKTIARMFGIKQPHVSRIQRGVSWKTL